MKPRHKTRPRWMTPEIKKAIAERAAKTSAREAARHFGCTPPTVRKAMKQHKIPSRRPGNYTNAEIAAMKL